MSAVTLFEVKERYDLEPAQLAEPLFAFYSRSNRPDCQRAREILEQWFAAYPEESREELRARFQSSDEYNHAGAFFELYCHALLARQGFTIELHPHLRDDQNTHPDFRVFKAGIPAFYLESTIALPRDHADRKRLNQVYDGLNQRLHSADFFLHVTVVGDIPRTTPSITKVYKKLQAWLDCLNADEVAARALAKQAQGHRGGSKTLSG